MGMPISIDQATLDAARAGSRDAHARIYERCAPRVFTLARRMLASTSLAEDVLQDTFVEVIRKLKDFRGQSSFETWITRIAVNKCLSLFRSSWWAKRSTLVDDEYADGRSVAAADADIELARLLDRLPATARAVVWLHDGEGYTHDEIGGMMGRTASFSKSQLKRAHDRLRADLDEPDSTETLCTGALKTI
jgi:RNA polymerase sigma-70 factor (ECF subfamily)